MVGNGMSVQKFKAQCSSMQRLPYPDFLKPMSESPAMLCNECIYIRGFIYMGEPFAEI
jgi:hypothetical protein